MRRLTRYVALASLTLVTGCGGDSLEGTDAASTSAAAPRSASVRTSGSAPDNAGGGDTVLTATVGTAEDPDAYVIALTDAAGETVTTLPAGSYTIKVSDLSDIHNWHLTGGSVDEATSVPDVVDTTFEVTLDSGEYTYVCDPHPSMVGQFTVT